MKVHSLLKYRDDALARTIFPTVPRNSASDFRILFTSKQKVKDNLGGENEATSFNYR